LAFIIVSAGDNKARACLRECKSGGPANTCQRAGNQNNLVLHKTISSILESHSRLVPNFDT
jgi:hypothetical protein